MTGPSAVGRRNEADAVMGVSGWLGIGVGLGVVGLHAATRILTHRLALRASDRRAFLIRELGGLGGRMVLVLCAVASVLFFVPVRAETFVGTVLTLLIVSMVVEARLILRGMDRGRLGP